MNDRKEKCRHDDATNRVHRSSKVLALALGLLVCVPLGGWAGNNLSPLPATSSGQSSSSAQQKNGNAANKNTVAVSGVVRDDQGEPLPGAVVRVVGNQSIAMVTDINGAFKLSVPANATLEVSSIGFKTKQVKAGKGGSLTVDMGEDPPLLNEVVVVGYGQMRRKDITTAVSSVSTKDIDERPIINAGEALQGKAAGIQVVQPSGMPGSGISVRMRGTTSVQASNEPLYIVDRRPVDDISDLSPNDIESIQILKDASSAAIYGARAANGVVLIETRHGKDGKSQIKFSTYVGFSKLGKKIDVLNTEEYKDLMKDLKQYMNTAPTIPDSEMRYTDWSDLFFKTGVDQNYQLSVSNGNDKVQYYVSGGFTNQKGIVHKANFRRYNFRANIDGQLKPWLKSSLSVAYSHTGGQWIQDNSSAMRSGSILSVINTPPFMTVWDPDNPTHYDEDAYGSRIMNPMAATAADSDTQTDYLSGSFSLLFNIAKGLTYKSTFGINLNNEKWNYYLDPVSTNDGRGTNGSSQQSFSRNFDYLFDNIVTYDHSFGLHHLNLMGGFSLQHATYDGLSVEAYDMALAYPWLHTVSAANQINRDGVWGPASA